MKLHLHLFALLLLAQPGAQWNYSVATDVLVALRDAGHEVLVVAPDRDRSGASNSLTLDAPVRFYGFDGPMEMAAAPSPRAFLLRLRAAVAEVAARMRVSKMTVYRLVHNGELPAVRVGRSFRVPEHVVEEYLSRAYTETA